MSFKEIKCSTGLPTWARNKHKAPPSPSSRQVYYPPPPASKSHCRTPRVADTRAARQASPASPRPGPHQPAAPPSPGPAHLTLHLHGAQAAAARPVPVAAVHAEAGPSGGLLRPGRPSGAQGASARPAGWRRGCGRGASSQAPAEGQPRLGSPRRAPLPWLLTRRDRGSDWWRGGRGHDSLPLGLGGGREGRGGGGGGAEATGAAISLSATSPASPRARTQARREPQRVHALTCSPCRRLGGSRSAYTQ